VSAWGDAYSAESARLRALNDARPGGILVARTPVLVHLGRLAAKMMVALPRARTVAMSVGGFGCLVAAAWTVAVPAGLAAAGVSLLVLEYLSGDQAGGRR
jgi:hydrogenase/urease accessory protein HupE